MRRPHLLAAAVGVLTACDSLLEVENPGSISDEEVRNTQSAELWVNGAAREVQVGWDAMLVLLSSASDEFRFIGTLQQWRELDRGNLSDPANSALNQQYPLVASAQWMADEAIGVLDSLAADGGLPHPTQRARTYLSGAIAYGALADGMEDYAPSDRTEPGPAIGPPAMVSLYDTAIAYATRGLALDPPAELRRNLLATRARAAHARAIRERIRPVPANQSGGGLVNAPGAAEDAGAALAVDASDWRHGFSFPVQVLSAAIKGHVCFGNYDFGNRYLSPAGDPSGTVALLDPIDGVPDPWLERFILTEFEPDGLCNNGDLTYTSAREMHLILAEQALFNGELDTFAEHVNTVRAFGSLTSWTPASPVAAHDLLVYERQSQLFLTGRRLADMYRFGILSDTWDPDSDAASEPGTLFPIPADEVEANCYLNGTCG